MRKSITYFDHLYTHETLQIFFNSHSFFNCLCVHEQALQPHAEADVRKSIAYLVEEGHLYSTIDDEHYKVTDML
jgi:hypothetical protein